MNPPPSHPPSQHYLFSLLFLVGQGGAQGVLLVPQETSAVRVSEQVVTFTLFFSFTGPRLRLNK